MRRNTSNLFGRRGGPKRSRLSARTGAAAVELALCLPVLVPLYFGTLETSNLMLTQARMQAAAYESVRLATRPTTSTALAASAGQVSSTCTSLLTQLGVQGATVTVNPGSLSGLAPQTLVTVTVSAPFAQNTLTSVVLGSSMTLTASATMVVE